MIIHKMVNYFTKRIARKKKDLKNMSDIIELTKNYSPVMIRELMNKSLLISMRSGKIFNDTIHHHHILTAINEMKNLKITRLKG